MPFETATPLESRLRFQPRTTATPLCFERKRAYELTKRLFDICFSVIVLIAVSPIFVIIACAIKLNSPGPVIFAQVRIGRKGRSRKKGQHITIYKFRTMHREADPYCSKTNAAYGERLTSVGRFLRAASLDELPQFFNVLRGDLSVVGPRPEMPFIVEEYGPLEEQRLLVKPGITGLWQIHGSREQLIHENIHYDLDYIARRNLLLDLLIVAKTAAFVLRIKNM